MESALIVITLLSLFTTIVMASVAYYLFREERRRSHARVVALEGAIALVGTPPVNPVVDEPAGAPTSMTTGSQSGDEAEVPTFYHPAGEPAADLTGRLLPALVAGAVIVTVAAGALVLVSGAVSSGSAALAAAPPLELLSLSHTTEEGQLAITGSVRNPAGAPARANLTAVMLFFDRDGAYLGSDRRLLTSPTLGPGQSSSFLVVSRLARVARYRVSFRSDDERALAHVDLRGRETGR
jgi:hypothetical protein